MSVSRVAHDHIVLLLEKDEFENPPAWLTENFNIIEGGTHTGGSSRNKLIIFKDGTYLELFTWISEPVEFLAWATKKQGLIDFALTTMPPISAQDNYDQIRQGLSSESHGGDGDLGIAYEAPKSGGRKRKDGIEVKWETTRPIFTDAKNTPPTSFFPTGRNEVPFFCHDMTERRIRVPFDDKDITTHPCGATGIYNVKVLAPDDHVDAYISFYSNLLGVQPEWYSDDQHVEGAFFSVASPIKADGVEDHPSYLSVYPSPDRPFGDVDWDNVNWLKDRGISIRELTLRRQTIPHNIHDIGRFDKSGIGSTVRLLGWSGRDNAPR